MLLTDCLEDVEAGAERQIFELANRIHKDQYRVTVVSLGLPPKERVKVLLAKGGVQFLHWPVKRIYGWSGLIQGMRFRAFLVKEKVDILQTYHFGSDIWGALWGSLAGVKNIISNRRDMGFWRKTSHIVTYKLLNGNVKKIVTVTASVKQLVQETEGVAEQKVDVIYNGVELTFTERSNTDIIVERAQLGIGPKDLVVVHVANIRPVKGHKYLIAAMQEVVKKHPNLKLLLIGDDTQDGEMQELVAQKNLEQHILFLGKRQDARMLVDLADICVLPSLSEGMSNAILEYMAAGKPVIASAVGGNPELITPEVNGLLVPAKDSSALAAALQKLIESPESRARMGQSGLAKVQSEFTMATMIHKYERLYDACFGS